MLKLLLIRKHDLNKLLINLYYLNRKRLYLWISVSIMDRDRYLEIAVTRVDNANYLIYACKTKPLLNLFLLVLKTVLKMK